jgi:hypothetical protein
MLYVKWIELAQNRNQWWTFVIMGLKLCESIEFLEQEYRIYQKEC